MSRYLDLRMQLADLRRSFTQASTHFPATFYDFVEANSPLPYTAWQRWVDSNRIAEEKDKERWDIYPSGWAVDYDCFASIESTSTRICGVLLGTPSTIDAAQAELEHLAATGTKILLAIRNEAERLPGINNVAAIPRPLPEGHRGWLNLVRITAEVNRGARLKVDYPLFNVAIDRQSQLAAAGKSLARVNGAPSPEESTACRVTPDIFSASANAITIWLDGTLDEPIVPLVCPGLAIPKLPSLNEVKMAPKTISDSKDSRLSAFDSGIAYSSDIRSPMEWAHLFNFGKNNTGSRRFIASIKDGSIRAIKSTTKKYRVAIANLPPTHPESPRNQPFRTLK